MGFTCGIIGLPNVGKSTIFNALSNANALIANYPFTTIEPNKGIVTVPDERLLKISELLQKDKPIPTRIEFIDVAGLVKGASKGEGLGNRFLSHIREVDAIVHVVRCFHRGDVVHVTGEVDPVRDVEVINTELLLSDMEILEKAREKQTKLAKLGDKETKTRLSIIERAITFVNEGKLLKNMELHPDEKIIISKLGLISIKPVLYCVNIDEDEKTGKEVLKLARYAERENSGFLAIAGKLEEEISELPPDEKNEYLKEMGIGEWGLKRLIKECYRLLDLITYYTAETDLQAWTLLRGTTALRAAGKIHSDFERGFIRAEVYKSEDLLKAGSEHHVKEWGKLRSEGKEYIIEDGEIVRFLFHV